MIPVLGSRSTLMSNDNRKVRCIHCGTVATCKGSRQGNTASGNPLSPNYVFATRTYPCEKCGKKTHTREVLDLGQITVTKSRGPPEEFDGDKLLRSVSLALAK